MTLVLVHPIVVEISESVISVRVVCGPTDRTAAEQHTTSPMLLCILVDVSLGKTLNP